MDVMRCFVLPLLIGRCIRHLLPTNCFFFFSLTEFSTRNNARKVQNSSVEFAHLCFFFFFLFFFSFLHNLFTFALFIAVFFFLFLLCFFFF